LCRSLRRREFISLITYPVKFAERIKVRPTSFVLPLTPEKVNE